MGENGKTPALEMRSITKTFTGVRALDNVSFTAYKGEILSLVGENGAGKSTLMKILSGSYPASSYSGEIYVNGRQQKFHNTAQAEAAGIAMIYQETSMHLDLSVTENIFLNRWMKKHVMIQWTAMREKAKEYLKMVHLDVNPSVTLRQLSASQQQLVAIARALQKQPEILVLDEPTSSLTQEESEELFKILKSLREQNKTIILISHKLEEVFENSDRITVLRDGSIISSHIIGEIDQQQVVTDMVGREIENYYPKEPAEIGEIALEARHFTVGHPYTRKNIVEDISFYVRSGEILGIAGLVGAGRSETVEAIFGKRKKVAGEVYVDGELAEIRSPRDAIEKGIALVTEDRRADGIVGIHSISDNAVLVSMDKLFPSHVIKPQKLKKEVQKYFDQLNIKAPNMDMLVQKLSGGNQQKVVLSKWLMQGPKILILDEPTRGIDVGAKAEIYKIMVQLAKQGIAIIMISSELPEILNMSDRILVIGDGRIKGEFNAAEATQKKIMEAAVG